MFKIIGGLFMGWSLGANDAANIFGTGVMSRLIRFRTAVILLGIFVVIGAVVEGPKCMDSIRNLGKMDLNGAFLVSMAAAITMTLLTIFELPSSTSQAIVGAIVGATLVKGSPNLAQLGKMVVCWILTPVGGAVIGYLLYRFTDFAVRRYLRSARTFQTFLKITLVLSGCYGSYALGANNVANTTGVYVGAGLLSPRAGALWGGLAIALGAVTYSRKVMNTVGNRITLIGPEGAVIATLAHSLTVHIYTQIGIPVSSSQAIVGSVIGIGLVRGIKAVSKPVIIKIVAGWFFTPLCAGVLAWGAMLLFH